MRQRVLRAGMMIGALNLLSPSAFAQSGQLRLTGSRITNAEAAPSNETIKPLSMEEAVKLALEQNLGIRIQRIDPQIQDVGIGRRVLLQLGRRANFLDLAVLNQDGCR